MAADGERVEEQKKELQKIISKRIERLCDERQITYYQLAYASSIAMSSLMNIVDGASKNPGVYNIIKICDGLGMTLSEFFDTKEFEDLLIDSRDEK